MTPTTAAHAGNFAILVEPIPSGGIGLAMVSGVVARQVSFNAATDQWADVKNSDATQLNGGTTGGAQVLGNPS